jgi:4-hydroxythreonine-4-phosphate dehydrogenase
VNELFQEGKMVFGPYPADGFFGNRQYEQFDAVLAMYHDQGLIPFKTLSFGSGVNFTAGLSKIRTSPDHGTAFDIAGKGLADNGSFREAVYAAIDLYRTRAEYNEISSKPLKIKAKQL